MGRDDNPRDTGARTRHFLFLQGLAGPFFSRLGAALQARGHAVSRVNFHAGDQLDWKLPGAFNFRSGARRWPGVIERLLVERGITDIVLFGDCRPLHRTAITIAGQLRVQVHVFEEGYIRPDWVTIELGGVNGHSTLPRDPEWYLETARRLPPYGPDGGVVPSSFARRAWDDLSYNISAMLLFWLYPGYRTHRPWHPLVEYIGWAGKLLGEKWAKQRASACLDQLAAAGRSYFVFPLQLDCDYQIRLHSPFRGMQPAIERVLRSFAAHAPAEALLVVKAHPLDNRLIDWRARVAAVAASCGLGARMLYLESGDIGPLVRGAAGVVTVNSTTGTLALAAGVPVITLGQAVYDLQGVTYQGELEAFWHAPVPPDPAIFEAFRRVVVDRCLVRGGYFSEEGLAMLVAGSVGRLEAAEPVRAAAVERVVAPVVRLLGVAASQSA